MMDTISELKELWESDGNDKRIVKNGDKTSNSFKFI